MAQVEYEIVKHVTLPLLKIAEDGSATLIKFEDKIFTAKKAEGSRQAKPKEGEEAKPDMAPPELAHVTDLKTGKPAQIIVNSVLSSQLKETYPDDTYVGKMFQVSRLGIAKGKRYATFEILEIRPKLSVDSPAPKGKK